MSNAHYKQLERIYLEAPINQLYKPLITISEGRSEIRIEVDPRFFHAKDALHGSVYFKMLDDAAFFAANSVEEESFILTAQFNVHFFQPVDKGTITAIGLLTSKTKRLFVAEARLFNEDEKEIALGTGTFMQGIPLNS